MTDPHNPYRTFVHVIPRNYFGPSAHIDIHIGRTIDMSGRVLMRTAGGAGAPDLIREPDQPLDGDGYKPALSIDETEARALLSALQRFFGEAEDTRSLRRDYDAERARVDRLIAHLTSGRPA